ncbi:TPA: glycerophosphodiester phosphodiesterase [Candidatus Woesearchaeota archaeon]|nr:glycerophosphodiester phosphodiesterase [Candidatus Woesearchaeota archaeon]
MSANMNLYSHRCLGFGHPENSMHALRDALESGIEGIEIDIRLTKDRKWVVLHNPFFADERRNVERVHMKTYGQIRREVTLLDTMLAYIAARSERMKRKTILIDVKDVGEERQIARMLASYDLTADAVVIAWEPEVLRRIRSIDPSIRTGLSYIPIHSTLTFLQGELKTPIGRHKAVLTFNKEHSFDARHSEGHSKQHYLATLPEFPVTSIQVYAPLCSAKLVRLAHKRGMKVIAFTVNNRVLAALLKRRGVDGILTNDPKKFLK